MEPNELEEVYLEKVMKSGETMSLSKIKDGYDVDQWDSDGNNRWNRWYKTYDLAKTQYDRWN